MNICAPFAGIVRFTVAVGDTVATGDTLAIVETVKLEAPVVAPGPGVVTSRAVADYADVYGGDVILTLGEG
ncbi:biotin/lipoyl-containing protein [Corynebacterium sp.]|uniref:biotin/lipoyl-containing protein n=1 Tax=Corynebacterium sp. TaxID=1720 RepID=UPI0026DB5CBD|nr:biotin/lipoyl-containing protein [Corynebacterium sp.]MDO5077967.1 biotin/lipoyl-containing protein [Corynebacterium sp.]